MSAARGVGCGVRYRISHVPIDWNEEDQRAYEQEIRGAQQPEPAGGSTPTVPSLLMTFLEAAAVLGFTKTNHASPKDAVRCLCRNGLLRYIVLGNTAMTRMEWIEEYIERESFRKGANKGTQENGK